MGEYNFINNIGNLGNFYIAADHATNLSALSATTTKVLTSKNNTPDKITYQTGISYVSFLVSDGDNLQLLLNRGNDKRWWGDKNRGNIPLGWTTSPALFYLAPSAWNYMVNTQSNNDQFVGGPSGIGYVFGNAANNQNFTKQLSYLNSYLQDSGIRSVSIFGYNDWNNNNYLSSYLESQQIDGAFYFEYAGWITAEAYYQTQWINNKPVIPANEYLTNSNVSNVANDLCANNKNNGIYAVYALDSANSGPNTPGIVSYINQVLNLVKQQCPNKVQAVLPTQLIDLAKQQHRL